MAGKIFTYYRYVPIENPKEIARWKQAICQKLQITGRILIATEGINGTVSGSVENLDEYKKIVLLHPLFFDMNIQEEVGFSDCFPRLQVTVKTSIVHFGTFVDTKQAGTRLKPDEFHTFISKKTDDLIVLDVRNSYESRIGKFDDALLAPIDYFRELPTYFDVNKESFKNKTVAMYCTGGIRCEAASAYLLTNGMAKQVVHLEGGIIAYAKQYQNGFFRGKNYVFDARVSVSITDDILSVCDICSVKCDEYAHCSNASCNKQIVSCISCLNLLKNCCSRQCHDLVQEGKVKERPLFKRAV